MLKKKFTRIIAFFLSCALVAVFTFSFLSAFIDYQKKLNSHLQENYTVSDEMNDIYFKLWAVGNMYLRNLDDNGNFTGTDDLEKQTVSALQELGCMDSDGNLKLTDISPNYVYFVGYGNNKFSNKNMDYKDFTGDYQLTRLNDNINCTLDSHWFYSNSDFNLYDTNYGMHYYFLNGKGVALYDFDTKGLDSYVDELGAVLYYKTDGSTPIPDKYYNQNDYNDYNDYNDNTLYEVPEMPDLPTNTANSEITCTTEYYDKNGACVSTRTLVYNQFGEVISDSTITDSDNEIASYKTTITDENGNIISQTEKPVYENGVYIQQNGQFTKLQQDKFQTFQLKEYPLTIAIQTDNSLSKKLTNSSDELNQLSDNISSTLLYTSPLIIVALVFAVFFLAMGGYSYTDKKFALSKIDNLFAELFVITALAAVTGIGVSLDNIYSLTNYSLSKYEICTLLAVAYALLFAVILFSINSLIVRIKCHSFWKSTLIYRFAKFVWRLVKKIVDFTTDKVINFNMLRNDLFTRRFIFRTIAFALLTIAVYAVCIDWNSFGVFLGSFIFLLIAYLFLSLLDLNAMNRICKHISDINSGDYSPHSELKNSSAYCVTQKLNNISAGIQSAVDKQIQSERMKIELVTNVSHDLKTPLTSIISYVDLLSAEDLPPTAKDYVNIIQNKSQRLKYMVADLFDLAKATTHTDVQLEKIDAVILLNQVLADMNDKIQESQKNIKLDIQTDSAPLLAEGKKMYRVLQNLIDNALKYSLDNTRIYITLKVDNNLCCFTIKNIASYEMNFSPDEITERFTRGDKSRSSDGNGLGLSIAKSFTEACNGSLNINIDGDLFIAEIIFHINNN